MGKEQDITYKQQNSDDDISRREASENSLSIINPGEVPPEQQEEFFYDELDRKCTLHKSGTVGSKIILHRKRTHYNGKNIYDIAMAILGIIGIILLGIFIFICAHGGWSKANIYDVGSGDKIGLFLLSIFIIFISFIGLLGSYTYWKPIILMTTFLSVLGFMSHAYVAKKFLDINRFAERNMAIPWWDTYTDEMIMSLQREYKCCGYLNYNDRAFITENCPKELVTWTMPADLQHAADVEKNDSYRKHFGTSSNSKIGNTGQTTGTAGQTTGTTDQTAGTTDQTAGTTDQTAGTTDQTTETDDGTVANNNATGNNDEGNDGGDNGDEGDYWRKRSINVEYFTNKDQDIDAEKLQREIELGIGRVSDSTINIPLNKRDINIIESDKDYYEKISKDIVNSIKSGKSRINLNMNEIKIKRQEDQTQEQDQTQQQDQTQNQTQDQTQDQTQTQTQAQDQTQNQTPNAENIVGCKSFIVDKVKSGITPLYVVLFIFLIVYVVIFGTSIIYWLDLRNEKDYDEFS